VVARQIRTALQKHNDCLVRILLLDPTSVFAEARTRELGYKKENGVERLIHENVAEIVKIYRSEFKFKDRLQLRMYNGTPVFSLYAIDKTYIMGIFWRRKRAVHAPQFIIDGSSSGLADAIDQHFDDIWDSATEFIFEAPYADETQ
jgi:hypothetical protein